jgi:hypothetical protein
MKTLFINSNAKELLFSTSSKEFQTLSRASLFEHDEGSMQVLELSVSGYASSVEIVTRPGIQEHENEIENLNRLVSLGYVPPAYITINNK